MGIGALVREVVGRRDVKELIKERFVESRDKPYLSSTNFVRASSFASLCPREEVLCSRGNIVRKRQVSADGGLVFAHGIALHYALQNIVLPATGVLRGSWRCVHCGAVVGAITPGNRVVDVAVRRPDHCEKCGSVPDGDGHSPFIFEEYYFVDSNYRITAHSDGLLALPGVNGLGVFEGKSINPRGAWKVRSVPNVDHVVQVHIYMMLTGTKWARLLYWDKAGTGCSALIEHHIERDEETIFKIQDTLKGMWAAVLDPAVPIPERTCTNKACPRATTCVTVARCFGE